jgi:hypothetical protein
LDATVQRRGLSTPFTAGSSVFAARAWLAAALLFLAVLLAPFLIVDVPPVLDYPNHLARLYVLAHPDDPVLGRMYAAHWSVLPNVGTDLLGATLLKVLPVHVAGRMLLALSLLAPPAGAILYARAAFGRWTWWSLGAGAIAFGGLFYLGFMNFQLGLGVALAGAAGWRILRRRAGPLPTALGGAVIGVCAFFCHLLGFAFFALLIGAEEAEALLALRREGHLGRRDLVRAVALLVVAVGPTLLLYAYTHHRLQNGDVLVWRWGAKLVEWMTPFFAYDLRLTALTAVVVVILGAVVARRSRIAGGVRLALAALAVLFVLAPYQAAGGAVLDSRFAVMAAFLLFAGIDPQLSVRHARVAAAALAALGLARSAEAAVNWQGRAQDLNDLRAVTASVEPGAKVLSAETDLPSPGGRGRELSGVFRMDHNLPGLLVIERRAFWPLLFADPSQQPMIVRPPYDGLAGVSQAMPPTWRDLARAPAAWRGFDYVLALGPPPPGAPAGLGLVRAGAEASLYRVER